MSLSVLTYNAHLFGQIAMIGGQETGLYYQDTQRASLLTESLRTVNADIVGLTEIWDPQLGQQIREGVADIYPPENCYVGPAEYGIDFIIDVLRFRWPRLTGYLTSQGRVQGMVDYFSQSHYDVADRSLRNGLLNFVSEDTRCAFLKRFFNLPYVWGSGLMLLSKYPISNTEFYPHVQRADLERFANKGTARVTVHKPGHLPTNVFLTHIQEGGSSHAMAAREKQLWQIRHLMKSVIGASVVMGDMNVRAESIYPHDGSWSIEREYRWMENLLGLTDTFRAMHTDVAAAPGFTYMHENPFEAKMGVSESEHQLNSRIDFILADPLFFDVLESRIPVVPFTDPEKGTELSDHRALWAKVAKAA